MALANNPRMVETTATLPFPFAESDGRDFIAKADCPSQRAYAIVGADDRFMGTMLFKLVEGKHPEIGYWLGEAHWGQGFAAEALQALLAAVGHPVAVVGSTELADHAQMRGWEVLTLV